MATEYRLCTKREHPGYLFAESSPWGIPGLWMAEFAVIIEGTKLDAAVATAEARLAEILAAKRGATFTKYLGRLP